MDTKVWSVHAIERFAHRMEGNSWNVSVVHDSDEPIASLPTSVNLVAAERRWNASRRLNHAIRSAVAANEVIAYSTAPLEPFDLDELAAALDLGVPTGLLAQVSVGTDAREARLEPGPSSDLYAFTFREHSRVRGVEESRSNIAEAMREFAERVRALGCRRQMPQIIVKAVNPLKGSTAERADRVLDELPVIANLPVWHSADPVPFVSVVIATRDRGAFLASSIYSVLAQTMPDLEVVVVDDGSTDHTQAVVASIKDPRVRYYKRPALGIAAARNFGTSVSRGHWIAVHDDDDLMVEDRIAGQLATVRAGVDAVYGAWANFSDDTGEFVIHLTRERFDRSVVLHNGQSPGHPTWLIRRELLQAVPYDTRLSSAVDHDVALRLLRLGTTWKHYGKVATLRRIHSSQVSATDGTAQKSAAIVARSLQGSTLNKSEMMAIAAQHTTVKWPQIDERRDPFKAFGSDLPDHLVSRNVIVVGRPLNVLVELDLVSKVRVVANQELRADVYGDEVVLIEDVSYIDLSRMRRAGLSCAALPVWRSEISAASSSFLPRVLAFVAGRRKQPGRSAIVVWTQDGSKELCRIAQTSDSAFDSVWRFREHGRGRGTLGVLFTEPKSSSGKALRLARRYPSAQVLVLTDDVAERE